MSNSSMKEDIRDLEKFIQLAKKLKIGDRDEYPRIRAEFNVRVIAALLGIEFDQDDDGKFEITDLKEPPSSDEIFHITRLVNNFITNVEERFIPGISTKTTNAIKIPEGKTINDRVFDDIVFKNLTKPLSTEDFMLIGTLGSELRKYRKRRLNYIIGGIAVGTIILIAGGVFYMKKNEYI